MRAMGTRATLEELKDMIAEVDRSGSNEIDFQEFCLFMVFKVGWYR
jgi:Ca2+-binding EF-hand superfamily protein